VRRPVIVVGLLGVMVLALVAAGCGGGGGGGGAEALPSSSCTKIEYGGSGSPDKLIASDFPLQGASRTQTVQMTNAIRMVLAQNDWKAGNVTIGYQSCDDATAQAAKWDTGKCSQNANAYANDNSVIGVIGTFNSGCAAIEIPILNQASDGGIAMVSPANTFVCLTQASKGGCDATEPDKYYPTGTRNYARVVAHDAYQGATQALLMKEQGVKSVYILNDKEAYGLGVAQDTQKAVEAEGIDVAGFDAWDPKNSSYEALFRKIKNTGADAVFLGGLIDENGGQLVKDKVAVLGDNETVKLFAPDGFTPFDSTIKDSGAANAKGMFVTVAGSPAEELTGKGAQFVSDFKSKYNTDAVEPYTAYAAQAAQVLLDAIAASDGTRSSVVSELFNVKITDGILGTFEITQSGDPTSGPVTVYTYDGSSDTFKTYKVMTPPVDLVNTAGGFSG
jgi:branched-chain amino acid transport system substrate-binding protein